MVAVIFLVSQQKMSYFNTVKKHFIIAYSAFAFGFLCEEITKLLLPTRIVTYFSTKVSLSSILLCIYMIGLAASVLYKKPLSSSVTTKNVYVEFFLKKPFLPFIAYNGLIFTVLGLIWFLTPFKIELAINSLSGEKIYIPKYELWITMCWLLVLVVFIVYPNYLLLASTRRIKSKETSRRLKQLSACLMGVGISFFVFYILLRTFAIETVQLGNFINTVLFAFMVHIFRKSTVLENFFEVEHLPVLVNEGKPTILLYSSTTDKMKILSSYIQDCILNKYCVAYFFPAMEKETVIEGLKKNGVNVEKTLKKGMLILFPVLKSNENFKESFSSFLGNIKGLGKDKKVCILVDYGNIHKTSKEAAQFFSMLESLKKEILQRKLAVLITFNMDTLSIEEVQKLRCFQFRTAFMVEDLFPVHLNEFSGKVGLSHSQVVGKKILMEFNPALHYEDYVHDFLLEGITNANLSITFLRKGSKLQTLPNMKKVMLSVDTKTPIEVKGKTLIVSMTDASIILEAFRRILDEYPNSWIVVDNLSDITLTIGFEKTYSLLRHVSELLADREATVMFLFNPGAHDKKVREAFRAMTDIIITLKSSGPKLIKA